MVLPEAEQVEVGEYDAHPLGPVSVAGAADPLLFVFADMADESRINVEVVVRTGVACREVVIGLVIVPPERWCWLFQFAQDDGDDQVMAKGGFEQHAPGRSGVLQAVVKDGTAEQVSWYAVFTASFQLFFEGAVVADDPGFYFGWLGG